MASMEELTVPEIALELHTKCEKQGRSFHCKGIVMYMYCLSVYFPRIRSQLLNVILIFLQNLHLYSTINHHC